MTDVMPKHETDVKMEATDITSRVMPICSFVRK